MREDDMKIQFSELKKFAETFSSRISKLESKMIVLEEQIKSLQDKKTKV